MKRMACRFILVALGFPLATFMPYHAAAQDGLEEVLSIVDACDILAAHPDDTLRVASGVADEDLVPRLAVTACEAALAGSDDVARHAFQLGRAKLEIDQREEAIVLFEDAADDGSAMALLFLGDAYQFGWNGVQDAEKALGYYRASFDAGLLIADIAIAQLEFDPDIFTTGPMLEVLVQRDVETAANFADNVLARAYLYAFAVELSDRCGSFLRPASVAALQKYRFPEGWSAASEEGNQELGIQDVKATYDVEVLVDRHGCNGYVIETVATAFNDTILLINSRSN